MRRQPRRIAKIINRLRVVSHMLAARDRFSRHIYDCGIYLHLLTDRLNWSPTILRSAEREVYLARLHLSTIAR